MVWLWVGLGASELLIADCRYAIRGDRSLPVAGTGYTTIVKWPWIWDLRIVFFRSNRLSNRIGRPIRFRIKSSNRIGRIYHSSRNTAWRTAGVPYRPIICWRLALWTNESDVRNWVLTCSFQFSPKTRQTMPLYAYLTPKVDFKRKYNHHQSFLYEWRLTARTIRKFRIGPSLRIEYRIGRTIRNRVESRSFAGPYLECMWL